MSPDQMRIWWYELEDMAGHVCDDLCRYRQELQVQEEKAAGSDRISKYGEMICMIIRKR